MERNGVGIVRVACCAAAVVVAGEAIAQPTSPSYSSTIQDAVTGDNKFTADGGFRWDVDPGADDYFSDVYERPTTQTYESRTKPTVGTVAAANSFYGFLDITHARFGYDGQYAYFQINLYSGLIEQSNGSIDDGAFGASTEYVIRLSDDDADGANGLLLRISGDAKELWGNTFQTKSASGYWDDDDSVGGPSGITTVAENLGSGLGYETEVIKSDGGLESNTSTKVLYARIVGPDPSTGKIATNAVPVVEFALDYIAFNNAYPGAAINPANLVSLTFEANRGTKGNEKYLWNDFYSESQAGSPYLSATLQNIYELDTVRGVPEPGSAVLLTLASLSLIRRCHWRRVVATP